MARSRLSILALALILAAAGFFLEAALAPAGQINETGQRFQLSAWIKDGSPPVMDEAYFEQAARYDFIMHAPGVWEGTSEVRWQLKQRNPDIKLGTYFNLHTLGPWMGRHSRETYPGRLWAAGSPYLVKTTTGDTAAVYRNYPVYDFTSSEARAAMIAELDRYVRVNELQWAMLDYCPVNLPDHRQGWPGNEGDMDLDGNGIGYWDDKDERDLAREAWFAYITELREALPEDFLLIPNGELAMKSEDFARLVDGCFVENFPHWFFGSQAPNYQNALDQLHRFSLHHLTAPHRWNREPGFVMLGNPEFQDWTALATLFDGVVVAFNQTGATLPPVPNELGLGQPRGSLTQRALMDSTSGYVLKRDFESGRVNLTVINNQIRSNIVLNDK